MLANSREWHLRFGVTPRCNFRCRYCLPANARPTAGQPPTHEVTETVLAAAANGIRRVHWTGGEPTMREDFRELVAAASAAGMSQQVVTTNGYRLWRWIDELAANGLTRAIVSLDTLDPERNRALTRADHFEDTVKTVQRCVTVLPTMTKLSVVTMRSTLSELPAFVRWCAELNSRGAAGKVAIKLNQFFPSNPAQLSPDGQQYWRDEFVPEADILTALAGIGDLVPVTRDVVDGDNPSYRYYQIGSSGVLVGVLALFSWDFPCGGCHKLRISPQGIATICINQVDPPTLWNKPLEEKQRILAALMRYRVGAFETENPDRRHYRGQLGELRFGKVVGPPVPKEHFSEVLGER